MWQKKKRVYVVAAIARDSGLVVGMQVLEELEWEAMQEVVGKLLPLASGVTAQTVLLSIQTCIGPMGTHIISVGKDHTLHDRKSQC